MFKNLFRKKEAQVNKEAFLKYFRMEASDDKFQLLGDFTDKDILEYYSRMARFIQSCLRHHKIEHYLTAYLSLAGQKMEITVIKDGEKGPTALLEDAKLENAKLLAEIADLKQSKIKKQEDTRSTRNIFIEHIHDLIDYWHDLPNKTPRERMEGIVFSLLVTLDGESGGMPAYLVKPLDEDGKEGEDIAGSLHEVFAQKRRKYDEKESSSEA
jgi:hypothetical protein